MVKILIIALALPLAGCMGHYGTAPVNIGGKLYDVVCPDPAPLHPDVFVGSTPCKKVPR